MFRRLPIISDKFCCHGLRDSVYAKLSRSSNLLRRLCLARYKCCLLVVTARFWWHTGFNEAIVVNMGFMF